MIEIFIHIKNKKNAGLHYWVNLPVELTEGCNTRAEKIDKLMEVAYEITFPRYKKDLYLEDDSFAGKTVLDVGCGPHAGLIGFRNCKKYGVDYLIDEYRRIGYPLDKHDIKYYNCKSEKLPFDNEFFDVVTCVNALDHVDSLKKTIKEISRVLKVGGKFIGQINFHEEPTITEPICMTHPKLVSLLKKYNVRVIQAKFQYRIRTEDRYYYECEKM